MVTRDNQYNHTNKWISKIVFTTFLILILLNLPTLCQAHSHDDSPSFKYSKETNEARTEHSMHQHQHHHHHRVVQDKHIKHAHQQKPVTSNKTHNVFLKAITSTLIISVVPLFILFFVPLDDTKEREPLLKILLSFASGGLLGDAFLHLIPHALLPHYHESKETHSHQHSHSHDGEESHHVHDMSVGLCVLLGIIVFLIVEKAVRLIKTDHTHSYAHSVTENVSKEKKTDKNKNTDKRDVASKKLQSEMKIIGYLNLAADFLHNFTDGLAIGASYLAGNNIGFVTTIIILLHEIPHEIGDFAILIQSGCSKRKAMMLQIGTAVSAMLGTCVSLFANGIDDLATMWILPFTAGGFIYIATVSVIPELLTDTKFGQSVLQIIALLSGVYMMVFIAKYE